MNTDTIDQQYADLQSQSQQVTSEIATLAEKLKSATQSGNQDAREWMLDLKEIALAIQAEQNQVGALLQALHGFVANAAAPTAPSSQHAPWPGSPQPGGNQPQTPPPGYAPQAGYPKQQPPGSMGDMLGSFMNSGFGSAMTMGVGFGIGDGVINRIFGGFGRRGC